MKITTRRPSAIHTLTLNDDDAQAFYELISASDNGFSGKAAPAELFNYLYELGFRNPESPTALRDTED